MMTLSGKPNSTANSVAETLGFRECLGGCGDGIIPYCATKVGGATWRGLEHLTFPLSP